MTPLRILYHHRTQGRGAEGNHIVSVVNALRNLGHEVDVLSPPGIDPFDPSASIPVDKAGTSTRGWSTLWKAVSRHLPNWLFEVGEIVYNVPAYLRVRRALRTKQYDLVFERYAFFMLAGAIAARQAGLRFVLEANEVSGIPGRARRQSFPSLAALFERALLRRCTLVHAVSSYLGERLLQAGLDPPRLVTVPNGFDVRRLRITHDRQTMRRELGFGADALVIGFAGWFDHWDRLDFLVDVFATLRRENPRLRLCIVGDGPAAAGLKEQAERLGVLSDLMATGAVPRERVYDYIQTFDIGILPHSNSFGSPIVMFEMMGLGVPLVLPRVPPVEDVHTHEATALLFDPLDAAQCAACLTSLAASEELRNSLASRARDKLTMEHSWERIAAQIIGAAESRSKTPP